jgi:TonB family protein
MSFVTATCRAASADLVNRRLVVGLLLSIILHAMLLSLQFGVPGLGLPAPFKPQPISITIVPAEPVPATVSAPPVRDLAPMPPAPAPTGMQVLAPAPRPTPAAPVVAKAKPVKPRRISRPLPPREPVESPTRVIAQDQNPNDSFVVPLPQPQESVQKTVDPKDAQDGSDDGAETQAAQLAEAKRKEELAASLASETKAEQEAQERLLAAKQAEELKIQEQQRRSEQEQVALKQTEEQDRRQAALRQKQLDERAAQLQAEQVAQVAAREKSDELARAQQVQAQLRKQQSDQLAARQKADELVLKQKADEIALKQKAEEVALKQKAEELALKQKAEEVALKQKAEEVALKQKAEERALKQKADEQAARQRAEDLARQKAAEIARQQAEQAARQQAEQAARQQAEQVAAAGQRERERAASAAAPMVAGDNGAGIGGTVPKNLLGSDMGNRVRELTRGIDLLSGAPPQRARVGDERAGRRVVVGSAEHDVPLRMYVDSFRQKIERNGGQAFSPIVADRVRIDPLVSVAIRSDGSVEEVTIVRSSGHADTDNAVRRIVRLNARYSAFPPNIASKYDVIEIRRIWSFAESLRLLEELR